MKKRWILFLTLASACILMLSMTGISQSSRRLAKKIEAISKMAGTSWATPVNISNNGTISESPNISLDAQGKVYLTWVDWTGNAYSRDMNFNTNATGSWGAARTGAPLIYTAIDDVGFPAIAASPSGGIATVAYHDGDFSRYLMSIFAFEYNNGSLGYSRVITSDTPVSCSYVTVAVSPTTKNLFAVFMGDVEGFKLIFKYQDANTKQWSGPSLLPLNEYGNNYLPQMCVDAKGTAHLVWISRPNPTVVMYSKNATPTNPNSWTAPVTVSPSTGLDWTYPRVAADADGDAYVVWHDVSTGNSEVFLRKTVNGQWQASENISKTGTLSETASVAVNGSTKEIYVAWQERVTEEPNWEVYAKTYEEDKPGGTKTWSDALHFSNSNPARPRHSGEPRFAVAANGDVHLAYFDQLGSNNTDIFYTFKEKIKVYPPLDVALTTKINKILFYSEKINTITFSKNSQNTEDYLDSYKIYRKKAEDSDDLYQLLATLNTSTFKYDDKRLSLTQKYAYALTAVDKGGNESGKVAVTEK
jgi:hypothetical protein